jgi:hypothetical protein
MQSMAWFVRCGGIDDKGHDKIIIDRHGAKWEDVCLRSIEVQRASEWEKCPLARASGFAAPAPRDPLVYRARSPYNPDLIFART